MVELSLLDSEEKNSKDDAYNTVVPSVKASIIGTSVFWALLLPNDSSVYLVLYNILIIDIMHSP